MSNYVQKEDKKINFEVSVADMQALMNQKDKNITSLVFQLTPGDDP